MYISIIYIISSFFVFFFGIKLLTFSLTNIYTEKIKYYITKYIKSDLSALFVGAFVSGIIQSSNAVTIISLALVSSKFISFNKGLYIIIGSNIGTTLTSFIIGFDFIVFIPLFLIVGVLLFIKNKHIYFSYIFISLGLIFYGLNIMSLNLEKIFNEVYIYSFINSLNDSSFFSMVFGVFLSSLIQSSSASIGIIQKLYNLNVISLNSSIAFMLGANVGTTLTGLVVSFSCSNNTKKIAIINTLFNLIGSFCFFICLERFSFFILNISEVFNANKMIQIAISHLFYNFITVLLFFIFYRFKTKKVD